MSVGDFYTDGSYLKNNPGWGSGDSEWKAAQIASLLRDHGLSPGTVCDIGCGAGGVLDALRPLLPPTTHLTGYEPSPQAYDLAKGRPGIEWINAEVSDAGASYDLGLVLDVFEHVEDYFGFLRKIRPVAQRFVFHIPLDMTVSAVARMRPIMDVREGVGHLHYFCRETALAALEDTGFSIVDERYTDPGLTAPNPSRMTLAMRWPRRIGRRLDPHLTARLIGGFSLLVLAAPRRSPNAADS